MNFLEIYPVRVNVHKSKVGVQDPIYEQVIQVSIQLLDYFLLVN